jgi:Xaa-Pro aminopeptidase
MHIPKKKKLKGKKKHEWGKIKRMKFQENMLFTIEPGIYVKGLGGCRIENDILLTDRSIKVLTNSRLIKIR